MEVLNGKLVEVFADGNQLVVETMPDGWSEKTGPAPRRAMLTPDSNALLQPTIGEAVELQRTGPRALWSCHGRAAARDAKEAQPVAPAKAPAKTSGKDEDPLGKLGDSGSAAGGEKP